MWHTSILYIAGPFNSPHVGFFHITHSAQSNRLPVNRESLCCLDPLTLNLPVKWGLFCVNWLSSEEPKELRREPKCGPSSRGLRLGTTSLPGEASVPGSASWMPALAQLCTVAEPDCALVPLHPEFTPDAPQPLLLLQWPQWPVTPPCFKFCWPGGVRWSSDHSSEAEHAFWNTHHMHCFFVQMLCWSLLVLGWGCRALHGTSAPYISPLPTHGL